LSPSQTSATRLPIAVNGSASKDADDVHQQIGKYKAVDTNAIIVNAGLLCTTSTPNLTPSQADYLGHSNLSNTTTHHSQHHHLAQAHFANPYALAHHGDTPPTIPSTAHWMHAGTFMYKTIYPMFRSSWLTRAPNHEQHWRSSQQPTKCRQCGHKEL
jgi:hypothetical protein